MMSFSLSPFKQVGLLAVALFASTLTAHGATLTGDNVNCGSPTGAFSCGNSNSTVGPGVEFSLKGPASRTIDENFGALGVQFTFNFSGATGAIDITNTDLTSAFTGFNFVNSSNAAIDASNFSLVGGVLTFSSTSFRAVTGDTVTLGLTTTPAVAATPEPSSIALLGTGCIAMAGMVRRRFRFTGK